MQKIIWDKLDTNEFSMCIKETLHLRLKLVWSILLSRSFKKGFIWGWIWFEALSFTNPWRHASFEAGAGLEHFPLQIFKEKLHLSLELIRSILLYRSFKKVFIWSWIWFEVYCFTDPLKGFIWNWIWFEAPSVLKGTYVLDQQVFVLVLYGKANDVVVFCMWKI